MGDTRILILSEPFGSGHEKAGEALSAGLNEVYGNVRTRSVHAMTQFTPKLSAFVQKTYMGLLKAVPSIWGKFYEASKKPGAKLDGLISGFYEKQMLNFTREYNPEVIVCTHPFPAAVIGSLRRKGFLSVPLVGVVTDFDVHTTWVNEDVDLFLLQNDSVAGDLIKYGINPAKLKTTGIPVHPSFAQKTTPETAKRAIGLNPDLPVVLVAGGGWGLGPIETIVKKLSMVKEPLQIIVVCGINYGLRKRLQVIEAQNPLVKIMGYVGNINELMTAADLLVSKPGGLTSCETMIKGLPMVAFEAFGGQETYNAAYLSSIGAAVNPPAGNLTEEILNLLESDNEMNKMRECARANAKPVSAVQGAAEVLELIGR